jgi:hypothetical protein
MDNELPVCPDCGERHPPASDEVMMAKGIVQAALQLANGEPFMATNLLLTALYSLLSGEPLAQQLEALKILAEALGIQAVTTRRPMTGVKLPGNGSVN